MTIQLIIAFIIIFTIAGLLLLEINRADENKKESISFKEGLDLTDLPIITLYNNECKFNFLLDTGANKSIIDSNVLHKLRYTEVEGGSIIFGMEGKPVNAKYINMPLTYRNKIYEDTFQVVDMKVAFNRLKAESGVQLSGIIGSNFFQKYKYILDFDKLIAYSKK